MFISAKCQAMLLLPAPACLPCLFLFSSHCQRHCFCRSLTLHCQVSVPSSFPACPILEQAWGKWQGSKRRFRRFLFLLFLHGGRCLSTTGERGERRTPCLPVPAWVVAGGRQAGKAGRGDRGQATQINMTRRCENEPCRVCVWGGAGVQVCVCVQMRLMIFFLRDD